MIGSRIAQLRTKKGLSQAALARQLHVSPSAIGMYEQGRRHPSTEMLISLSQNLGVTLEYLITGNLSSPDDYAAIIGIPPNPTDSGTSYIRLDQLPREDQIALLVSQLMSGH